MPSPESPTPHLKLEYVAGRAARGAVALAVRQVVVIGTNLIGGVILARILSPADFGIYAIVVFVVSALNVFGDGGLGVSLIRQHEEPTELDLRAVFSAQQILVGGGVVLGAAAALIVAATTATDRATIALVLVFLLSVLITSFRVIPAVLLERTLSFGRIGTVSVAETMTFTASAVVFASSGYGPFSFGLAALIQALTGTILMNLFSPWRFRWAWRPDIVRPRFCFGIPYQGIGAVSFIKDSITPLLIGAVLGATEVGYVKWAQALSAQVLLALMTLDRVYFPAFARLQHRPEDLRRFLETVIRITNLVAAPTAALLIVYAPQVTKIVYGPKWTPALPILYWLCVANLLVPTVSPLFSLLSALGRSRTAFGFALLWMVGTWLLGVPLVLAFGAVGFGITNALIQVTNLLMIRMSNATLQASLVAAAAKPWVLVLPATALAILLKTFATPQTLGSLAAQCSLCATLFVVFVFSFDSKTVFRARAVLLGGRG